MVFTGLTLIQLTAMTYDHKYVEQTHIRNYITKGR